MSSEYVPSDDLDNSVLFPAEEEVTVTVDILQYVMNRVGASPMDSIRRIVMPPDSSSVEYQRLVNRPGEVFILLLYVEKHLNYFLASRDPAVAELYEELALLQSKDQLSDEWLEAWWARVEPIHMEVVAKNSDQNFSGLVDRLEKGLQLKVPDQLPANFQENGIDNLKELVAIRNTIGHSIIYNGITVDGTVVLEPHMTKHTSNAKRRTISTYLDDDTYGTIKSMVEDAHAFLAVCLVWGHLT